MNAFFNSSPRGLIRFKVALIKVTGLGGGCCLLCLDVRAGFAGTVFCMLFCPSVWDALCSCAHGSDALCARRLVVVRRACFWCAERRDGDCGAFRVVLFWRFRGGRPSFLLPSAGFYAKGFAGFILFVYQCVPVKPLSSQGSRRVHIPVSECLVRQSVPVKGLAQALMW